ncbi:MAG: 4-diphosphocytidyl-2-C-methyl-D-erythritol kinase [Gammaproteobacteria bacterium]|nr:4-diphosphocytidyl-2-C-methyl-D-erythritol kinase [Gammaproteobacteria bacterium]
MKLTLPSPAKLNLFLHIVGRKPNGYHELQTVFQLLDYFDTLTFQIHPLPEIICSQMVNIPLQQNLIYKAALCLQAHTGINQGAVISIQKRLPIGGGLGGGSSNAATTLLALNQLWGTALSINELAELGTTLGADVPAFVRGYSAWGEGIGEHLTAVALPEYWYLVITPPCHASTPHIFAQEELTRNTQRITMRDFLSGDTHNDLQPVACKLYPEIADAIHWLSQFSAAKMTGSGASVFASFPDEAAAQAILARLPPSYSGFVAKGVNRSPLHASLDKIPTVSV